MRWSKKTDFLSIKSPLLLFAVYLIILISLDKPFSTTSYWNDQRSPVISNDIYIWLQFVVFIFVCTITSLCFEETFRRQSSEFIKVLKPGVLKTILFRYLRLIAVLELIYLPCVYIAFLKANHLITSNDISLGTSSPHIDILKPMTHCFIAMIFYVTVTLFFLMILKKRAYVMVLFMGYCAFEASILPYVFGPWVIFRGAFFSNNDYMHYFPPNILLMSIMSLIMLAVIIVYGYLQFSANNTGLHKARV